MTSARAGGADVARGAGATGFAGAAGVAGFAGVVVWADAVNEAARSPINARQRAGLLFIDSVRDKVTRKSRYMSSLFAVTSLRAQASFNGRMPRFACSSHYKSRGHLERGFPS